ncbi:MAG TPA: hypothetical protein VJM34_12160 [Novosphingobium sp.]|nr:hypothetical protein [Novosphingobium sp.]
MLPVFLTIDTEYSAGLYLHGGGRTWRENFARSIACEARGGSVGVGYQIEVMDRHGLKGVFFVDPMPALVWGTDAIAAAVDPILSAGHDVQLHLHTEWLAFAERNPLGSRIGTNIADFTLDEQRILLDYACGQLVAAGAPAPVAFRAGNYGANDDTLRALALLGVKLESSFPAALDFSACRISLGRGDVFPQRHLGVVEVPISAIAARGRGRRHAQLTAMSLWELKSAVRHAVTADWPAFVVVSHSFEMMNRQNGVANRLVQRRFEAFCEWLGRQGDVRAATFSEPGIDERLIGRTPAAAAALLPHSPVREALRMGEQAIANMVYG